ncbi:MAG: TonB-dependent receptor [Rhodospirillales bacterium]|nr:TonB-dependent receptor [Rhodospirillales bacterium]
MSSRLLTALLTSTAVIGFSAAPAAFAQTDQQTASAGNGMEEIVVTARRKEERVQTVPIAITAFSQADIEKKQINQIKDLAREVPSLSMTASQSDPNALYSGFVRLRGLPGTVIYFNDVPLGSVDYNPTTGLTHGLSAGLYYDLDNLEAIKGPQGTLFGKNSIGGLISIEPKHPTNEFEGYGQVTLGNYNDREFEGAVNIPVIQDKLLVRIAGQTQNRDGYTLNTANGKDLDNVDYYSWRVGVTMRPTDDFENYFLYDGYYQHSNGSSEVIKYINPGFTLVPKAGSVLPPGTTALFPPAVQGIFNFPITLGNGPALAGLFNPATAASTIGQAFGAQAFSLFPTLKSAFAQQQALGVRSIVGQSIAGLGKDYFYGFTDVATWDVNDQLTIKNIAAARIFKQLSTDDFTSVGLPILNIGDPVNNKTWGDNSVQYTEELQIQGKALNDKLSWVAGGYLEFDHPLGDSLLPSTAAGAISYYHFHNSERSQALFAHGIYDLSDYVEGLRFTAGYRYTWDYVSIQERGTNNIDGVTRNANGTPNNCAAPQGFDTNCAVASNTHFSSYGWNLALDYQLNPDTLVYVRSGNAYRPGGTNPQVLPAFQNLKPEHVTDVEIGVKSDWELFGVKARTNADVFHTDYKAIQVAQLVQVVDSTGTTHAASETLNAASASLEGGEFEATFIPVKGVEISPHASYIFAQYDQYPSAFGALSSSSTPPFFYLPKWQYGVTGTYHLPVDESWGDIAIALSYSWYGHQYFTVTAGEIQNIMPSYENFDLRVDWTNVFGQPIDLGAFVSNLTDNTHITGLQTIYTTLGFTSAAYNAPRMFGFSVKYRFGAPSEPEETPAAYVPPPVVAPAPSVPKSYLVFFDFNKSDLTSQAASIVDQAAKNAGPARVTKLEVTGHTDTVGSDAYNMRLSRRRAESVAAQLEKDGIPSSEIEIIAKGKRDLLVPTADGVKEPQNRRVQIVYEGGPTS